jgi:hypothetical protein
VRAPLNGRDVIENAALIGAAAGFVETIIG